MSRYGDALRSAFGSKEPSSEREIDFEIDGVDYTATVEVQWEISDDSFDHEFGTEHIYSWYVEDWDLVSLVEHTEDDTVEIDETPKIMKVIGSLVKELSAD